MRQAGDGTASRQRAISLLTVALLFLAALWPALVAAAPSVLCPTLNATVAHGGSVAINVSSCDGAVDGGMSGPITPFASRGTVSIGTNAFGVQTVTYAHGGVSGPSDTFALEDNALGVVTVNITITPPVSALVVAPSALPALTAGSPFSQLFTSSGGVAPYGYSVVAGSLPPGLTLTAGGTLSGTPTRRGGFAFSVQSQDAVSGFVIKSYAGTVQNPSLAMSPAASTAFPGVAFSQALSIAGGVSPHTFALESGSFPAGITISSGGVVSGTTVAAAGNYPVTLRVSDSSTGAGTWYELKPFTLTVSAPPTVTIAVSPASVAEDGAANLVFTVTRSANLNVATVVNITTSGTATSGVDYTGAVATVTIPAGATTATITIDPTLDSTPEPDETVILTVAPGTGYIVGSPSSATGTILNDDVTIIVNPPTLPGANIGVAYSQTLTGSGGTGPYAFSVSAGALPTGLALSAGGVLGGAPASSGSFNFTVSATDASAFPGPYTGTRTYTVVVAIPATTATLGALVPSSGTLSPAFAPGTTAYTVQVPNGTASITMTPTATDPLATIKVNGATVASGTASGPIALTVGANVVTVAVTSRDASTTNTYTVTVTRAKATQAITFGAAPSLAVGRTATVTATGGGSGSPVVVTSQTTGVCTIAGATVTGEAEGTCTLAANQAGNADYDAAPQATLSFAVAPATSIPRLGNISTRMQVLTGDSVMIGGFIIGGTQAKTVVVRARGPSLVPFGITNPLANPFLQLFSGSTQIAFNDNWREAANQAAVAASGFAPSNDFESAILVALAPGAYTAIVTGAGGTTGVGIVEVFEVDLPQVPLLNISTRGSVLTGNDVMIGGFIIQGDSPQTVIIRARGPSLAAAGVPGVLANPMLQVFSGATQIAVNDNWQDGPDAAAIQAAGFAPSNVFESAIRMTLSPGAYTAIVTGVGGTTGIAIVEVFAQ